MESAQRLSHGCCVRRGLSIRPYRAKLDLPWPSHEPLVRSSRACEHLSSTRGVGTIPDSCPSGYERNGALCYPLCQQGYYGVGPVCWESCPAGYHDDGVTCRQGLKIISADNSNCPWYDKCGLTLKKGCSTCPPDQNYVNDGCTCRIPLDIITKKSYGRTAGIPLVCNSSLDESGALCYPQCPGNFSGNGPVCWQQCSTMYPVQCGWMCGNPGFNCSQEVTDFISAALQEVVACAAGPTTDCILGIAKLAVLFALDGLCPASSYP